MSSLCESDFLSFYAWISINKINQCDDIFSCVSWLVQMMSKKEHLISCGKMPERHTLWSCLSAQYVCREGQKAAETSWFGAQTASSPRTKLWLCWYKAAISWSKRAVCFISKIMPLEATVHSSRNTTVRRSIKFVFLNFLWESRRLNSSELINDHKMVS